MATPLGLRKVKVFGTTTPLNTEVIVDDMRGNFGYIEVTAGAADVDFIVNNIPEGGIAPVAIPVKANTTRTIPLVVYNFKITAAATVVAYGL